MSLKSFFLVLAGLAPLYNAVTALATPVAHVAAAVSPSGNCNGTSYQQIVLDNHNNHRANHSANALVWNTTLANQAKVWAERCVFAHGG